MLSTTRPRLECLRPITASVSFALRPTMSLFRSATTLASGTVGRSGKEAVPPQRARAGHEPQGALGPPARRRDRPGQLDHADRSRAVVVRAVADRVGAAR